VSYSTLDDIKKLIPEAVLIQLTDDEATGSVNQGRVDEAVKQADAEIDSYCGSRYMVPLPIVPDLVRKFSVDIAIYNLYSRHMEVMPETRAERYKNAIRQLEAVSKGTVSLGIDPSPSASTDGRAETNKETDGNVFSREKLEGF
jgi:phage gp36-like protein